MLLGLELNEQKERPALYIRTKTVLSNLPEVIGTAFGEIFNYLNQIGEQPADAPYTAYYNLDMQDLDVEMGFPVRVQLPGRGEIKSGAIPGGKIVSCMYKGPYAKMEEPYNNIFKWIGENGFEPKGVYYEYYYNSPDDVPENELLTKIVIPLK
ncbi:MAG: Bacterial transcription activator, effector binding domain [Firmicutes bacterium ADurb.Bin456]|nr:MAG: Bacterial transcription activator, effector binding domain [Firmicutes bacterium ADurb.Bin456]